MAENPYHRRWVNDEMQRLYETCEPLEVTGARYRLELRACKKDGRLNDDDYQLAQMVGISVDHWLSIRDMVLSGWEHVDGEILIPTVVEDLEHQDAFSRRAKKAAEARWGKRDRCSADAQASAQANACGGATGDAHADASTDACAMPLLPSSSYLLPSSSCLEEEEPRTPPASPSGPSGSVHAEGESGDTKRQEGRPQANGSPRARVLPPHSPDEELDDAWLGKLDRARSKLMRRDAKKAPRADREIRNAVQRAGPYRGIPVKAVRVGLEAALNHLVANPDVDSWDGYIRTVVLAEAQNTTAAASQAASDAHKITHQSARNGLERIGTTLARIGGQK